MEPYQGTYTARAGRVRITLQDVPGYRCHQCAAAGESRFEFADPAILNSQIVAPLCRALERFHPTAHLPFPDLVVRFTRSGGAEGVAAVPGQFPSADRPDWPADGCPPGDGRRRADGEPRADGEASPDGDQMTGGAGPVDGTRPVSFRGFAVRQPRRSFDTVILNAETRLALERAIALLTHYETLYRKWGLERVDAGGPRLALNFYGPPGTGKTSAAEALAHRLGRPLLAVSYGELESRYMGDTPKNIERAFRQAKEVGAVLFFDEADSVLGRRLGFVGQAADHAINLSRSVMLMQLDAFDGVVVFASNLVQNYDPAFARRILAHIEFPVPDETTRRALWRLYVTPQMPLASDVDLDELAAAHPWVTGSDIRTAVVHAALRALCSSRQPMQVCRADFDAALADIRKARQVLGPPQEEGPHGGSP